MDLKEELAKTAVQITCYDRTGKEVKRVTSADDGTVEDNEQTPGSDTGSNTSNTGSDTGGDTQGGDNTGGGSTGDNGDRDPDGGRPGRWHELGRVSLTGRDIVHGLRATRNLNRNLLVPLRPQSPSNEVADFVFPM